MNLRQRREKAERRQYEVIARAAELDAKAERTDDDDAELTRLGTERRELATELIAVMDEEATATAARADGGGEGAERRELRGRSHFHRFVSAELTGQPVDGSEAEYAAAEGCPGLVPLRLFGPTAEERAAANQRGIETRAVSEAPADSDVPRALAPIIPALFDRSVAGFLGIEMPTAATGIAAFPVLSTSLTGGPKAEDGAADEGAAAYTVKDADPRRITGAFRIRKEDIAKLPALEESLRANLAAVLSSEFDAQLVSGDNVAPNLNGLIKQLTDPDAPAANAETFARYVAAFASHVDGLFATMPADVRALVGPHTLRHILATFRADEDSTTAYSYLGSTFGGTRATRRIADPAAHIQGAIIRRSNPAGDRVAVAPVWAGLDLVRDPFTAAGAGQIVVTGTVLVGGVVVLRPGGRVRRARAHRVQTGSANPGRDPEARRHRARSGRRKNACVGAARGEGRGKRPGRNAGSGPASSGRRDRS